MNGIQLVNHFGFDGSHWTAIDQEIKISIAQLNGTAAGSGESLEELLCKSAELDRLGLGWPERGWVVGLAYLKSARSLSSPIKIIARKS